MKSINKLCLLATLSIALVSPALAADNLQPTAKQAKIARLLARELPREHLSRRYLDDRTAKLMLSNYLDLLDPEHVYFLDSDIQSFREKQNQLDDEIKIGDIRFAFDTFNLFLKRVRNRTNFVHELLKHDFDFTIDEDYAWKRKDLPWPKGEKEWNELWRKRVKNQYIQRIVSKELANADDLSNTNRPLNAIGPRIPRTSLNAINDFLKKPVVIYYALENNNLEIAALVAAEMAKAANASENNLTPAEYINKSYNQFLSILEDSDSNWVLQKYLSAFARSYDPHCDYMSQVTSEDFDIDMKLSLFGIGAMLRPEDGAAKIVSLVPGGPADSDTSPSHLRPGDKIIAVAQGDKEFVNILHWPLSKAVRIIRGPKGSVVRLKVIPVTDPSGSTTKIVTIVRDEVKLEASAAKDKIRKIKDKSGNTYKLGIIRLPSFYADMTGRRDPDARSASRDVAKLLRKLREKNIDGLVLDLRSNGGGSLLEAILLSGLFIETGPIVQVRERRTISILPDRDPSIGYSGPMIVLVNRLSASASEILAAAMQDYGRAVIIGDSKTHGKGSVQTILRLSRDPSMGKFKVTNALFYRISGGSTQLKGVTPDIVIHSPFDYMEFGEDQLKNPMEWTTIRSAIYSPFADLAPIIPQLRAKSEQRRATEKSFIAYSKLLKRIKAVNEKKTVSLNLDERRSKAKEEHEMFELQNKLMEQAQGNKDNDKDIVQDESLHILVDLIKASRERKKADAIGNIPDTEPNSTTPDQTPTTAE